MAFIKTAPKRGSSTKKTLRRKSYEGNSTKTSYSYNANLPFFLFFTFLFSSSLLLVSNNKHYTKARKWFHLFACILHLSVIFKHIIIYLHSCFEELTKFQSKDLLKAKVVILQAIDLINLLILQENRILY